MLPETSLTAASHELRQGRVSRRDFIARAAVLGVSAPVALALANSLSAGEAAAAERPAFGMQELTRGSGGELKVREWFAPDTAVAHLSGFPPSGVRVSSLILEPLLSYGIDGALLPNLVTKVPTKENGSLSGDLTRVTLELRSDVVWSDGEPFTADDVVWTWKWVTDEANQTNTWWAWEPIRTIESIGPTTVELYFEKPNLAWFAPIAGGYNGAIIPRHVWMDGPQETVNAEFATKPIGTGPYKIEEFVPGEYVVCAINERYRSQTSPISKPYASREAGTARPPRRLSCKMATGTWQAPCPCGHPCCGRWQRRVARAACSPGCMPSSSASCSTFPIPTKRSKKSARVCARRIPS